MLRPKRGRLIQQFRPLCDFQLLFILFFFLLDLFYDGIRIQFFFRLDDLCFRRIRFGKVNLRRHKVTIFLNNLSRLIFITELETIFVNIEGDLCSYLGSAPLFHIEFRSSVTFPMHRFGSLFIGKRIDVYLIRHHKCGIKTKAKMSDDLIFIRFILILFKKVGCPGKSDLVNILFHLVRRHADTVINKFQRLFFRIDYHFYLCLIIIRQNTFSHHFQLFPLRNRIAPVGNHLSHENIMVGIQPFFDNRKNIIAVY